MKKQYVMFILCVLNFSQANAETIKCVNESGRVFYADSTSKETGKELMSILTCVSLKKSSEYSTEELQQMTQKSFEKKTDQEREEASARLDRVRILQEIEGEEARYRIKVRETAKFLDDVEAARKRK